MSIGKQKKLSAGTRLFAAFILVLAACFAGQTGLTLAYVTDLVIYLPPDYLTFRPPSAGGSYIDPVFGTAIKRISDSMHTDNVAGGGVVTSIENEYPSVSAVNSDNTRLLLGHTSYFALYDGTGNFIKDLFQYRILSSYEPRWSRSDPNVFYYVVGNQLRQFNVGTYASAVVHTFSEYSSVSGKGESDICFDGQHLVLAGNNREIFVYDISTDSKGPVFDAGSAGAFDQLYITPDDNVIVGWYATGTARNTGVELFDKNMNFLRQLTHAIGHMDVTRDTDGEEVVLWANGGDRQLQVPCTAGVTKVRLSDARQTCVWTGNWNLAVHISASDNSGWFFIATYAPGDPIPPETAWKPYTNEILQVKLDGSEIRRLAHHRSRPFDSYTYTPKVSTNRSGTKLVYGSNFGLQSIGHPNEYTDAYMIDLESTTYTGPAEPVTVTRIEDTNNAVAFTDAWIRNSSSLHSGSSAALALEQGNRAMLSFNGTKVNWIAYADEWSGIANIYLDGEFKGEIDLYMPSSKAQFRVYGISGLPAGAHTLTVEVAGRRSASSAGNWIWIDAFDVFSGGTPVTLTWANPADITYGEILNATQLNATAGFNGSAVSGYFVYTPAAGTRLNAGAGQLLHVDFLPSDAARYRDASNDVRINVLKAAQTIAFGPLPGKTYGEAAFNVNAASSSGLPVGFAASGPCTVSGSVVTLTGAGSCTITAQQPGDRNFLPAADIPQSFTVVLPVPIITWSNPVDITYGTRLNGSQLNAAASVQGNPIMGSFIYIPAAGTLLNAGAGQPLHVDFTPADPASYATASKDVAINVLKAGQSITFGPLPDRTLGDAAFSVNATTSSELPAGFAASGSCAVSSGIVTLTGAGSCTITAQQAGDNNYHAAPDVVQSFQIALPPPRRIEQDNSRMQESGTWLSNNLSLHSGGSARLAMDIGARVSFTFTGSQVTWVAYRDQWSGIARIYIDGELKADVDTYSVNDAAQAPTYVSPDLPWGTHTITIEVTGQQNQDSSGKWIWFDALDYIGSPE